jgi:hypothetical protein
MGQEFCPDAVLTSRGVLVQAHVVKLGPSQRLGGFVGAASLGKDVA